MSIHRKSTIEDAILAIQQLCSQLGRTDPLGVGQESDSHQLLADTAAGELWHVVPPHIETLLAGLKVHTAADVWRWIGAGDYKYLHRQT